LVQREESEKLARAEHDKKIEEERLEAIELLRSKEAEKAEQARRIKDSLQQQMAELKDKEAEVGICVCPLKTNIPSLVVMHHWGNKSNHLGSFKHDIEIKYTFVNNYYLFDDIIRRQLLIRCTTPN